MSSNLLVFMELFVVFALAMGWGVFELAMLRRDRKRAAENAAREAAESESGSTLPSDPAGRGPHHPAGHSEGEHRLDPGLSEPGQR